MHDIAELCQILGAPKRLVSLGSWIAKDRMLRIAAALETDGAVVHGVSFLANCMADRADEKVSICLMFEMKGKPRAFSRIDWRGSPHGNWDAVCGMRQHRDAGRSHFHDINLHRHVDFSVLFQSSKDLPVAEALDPEPNSFSDLLEKSSELLHIVNLREISTPPWSTALPF